MRKNKIVTKPVRVEDLSLDELVSDEEDETLAKLARWETRRWRRIKHQMV